MALENDTICALATPLGGALAVVRVSGPECYHAVGRLLHFDVSKQKAGSLRHADVFALDGSEIDDAVLTFYRAPHSYTGEDAIEFSCHGSRYVVRLLLDNLIKAGCRQAEPGEYTRRAYLNGKMDLSQAEAVADIIASTNHATHQLAMSQLKGHVRTELETLRERLLKLTSLLELELDFSDHEDLTFADRGELQSLSEEIDNRIMRLADSYAAGKAIKNGVPVAIVGHTNVGKSTLLNRLLGEDRALVSDVHGTTRDSIEDCVDIDGITFRFIDTAGIRSTTDTVEKMGIERTWSKISESSIILWIIDALPSDAELSTMKERCQGKKLIIVVNKIDRQPAIDFSSIQPDAIAISAKTGENIDNLLNAIREAADIPQINETDVVITSARQYNLLLKAKESIERVVDGLKSSLPTDLVAEDLRVAIDTLSDITGIERITSKTTLDNIFKNYCIGK